MRGRRLVALALGVVIAWGVAAPSRPTARDRATTAGRNVIVVVVDGLRSEAVNPTDAPTMTALRTRGVYFINSHAVLPTLTTPNAAAIATGHFPGDTGGQGIHGSFSRADTFNFMAAGGPDFKEGFVDTAPVGNADIAITLAHILGIDLPAEGSRRGRVLSEALAGGLDAAASERYLRASARSPGSAFRTVLLFQRLGPDRYADEACFTELGPDRDRQEGRLAGGGHRSGARDALRGADDSLASRPDHARRRVRMLVSEVRVR